MMRFGEIASWITGVRSLVGSMPGFFIVAGAMIMLSACPITMS